MMGDLWLIVGLVVFIIILIITIIIIRKTNEYKNVKYKELVEKTEQYYLNLSLKDGYLFPYHIFHACDVELNFKSKGEKDPLSQVNIKKNYGFFKDRILYVINDNLKNKLEIIEKEDQKFIKISNAIKQIKILVSFARNDHLIITYKVNKINDKFEIVIEESEVNIDEKKK